MRTIHESDEESEDEARYQEGLVEYFSTRIKGKEKFNPNKKQKDYYYSHT